MKLSYVCRAMEILVRNEDVFQTLLLVGGEWSTTWPKEGVPGTHWMGRWVGRCLDAMEERLIYAPDRSQT